MWTGQAIPGEASSLLLPLCLALHLPPTSSGLRGAWQVRGLREGWGYAGAHQRRAFRMRPECAEVSHPGQRCLCLAFRLLSSIYKKSWLAKKGWPQAKSQLHVASGEMTHWSSSLSRGRRCNMVCSVRSTVGIVEPPDLRPSMNVWFKSCSHREGARTRECEEERGGAGRAGFLGINLSPLLNSMIFKC